MAGLERPEFIYRVLHDKLHGVLSWSIVIVPMNDVRYHQHQLFFNGYSDIATFVRMQILLGAKVKVERDKVSITSTFDSDWETLKILIKS